MNWLVIALQILVVGSNVRVSEGAPIEETPVGAIRLTVPCGNTQEWAENLEQKYREKVVFKGVAKSGIMKFYANDKTATFTVAYETGNMTCIVIAGNFLIKETDGQPL